MMTRHRSIFFLLFVLLLATVIKGKAQEGAVRYPLIPYPRTVTDGSGFFEVMPQAKVYAAPAFKKEAALFSALFKNSFGKALSFAATEQGQRIRLEYDPSVGAAEGYRLIVTTDRLLLSAATAEGLFRGIQTIRQLLPVTVETAGGQRVAVLRLPAVRIDDNPAYAWRGMHLDVSRHFFSIAYLKKMIDVMALYKLNKFHLHLTDDQGWRIEIKKYPKLTEEGAWRSFNNQDSVCMKRAAENPDYNIDTTHIVKKNGVTKYGGFYTQQEMRDLVKYAADRYITIVPEIDMPGHMMAAINAYRYLSCDGKSAFGELFSIPICPCLPTTLAFAKDIYTEILDIFPSEYIHIGGDEVDRSHWEQSEACKALMAKEGLTTTAELQSRFIREMEQFFHSKGRKLIGWDEILEGGVSTTAAIMYWRTWVPQAPVQAARNGNHVIMTPGAPLYFDTPPDKNSLQKVYEFHPVPAGLTPAQEQLIMGAQANVWTEYIPSEKRADYIMMPRMTALAEMLWGNKRNSSAHYYAHYLERLNSHYPKLAALKVHYRLPDFSGLLERYVFTSQTLLELPKPLPDLTVRYTLDSSLPTMRSAELVTPLTINRNQLVRVAAFTRSGDRGDVYDLHYQQQELATPLNIFTAKDGLTCSWFPGSFKRTADLQRQTPAGTTEVAGIAVPKVAESASFGLQYRGYIQVPEDGIYTFYLTCDDGGILSVADRLVVDNDGLHAPLERNGQVALQKGLHAFALDFIEGGGGYTLKLQYSKNGSTPQEVPAQWFKN